MVGPDNYQTGARRPKTPNLRFITGVERFGSRMDPKDVRIFCELAFRRHDFDSTSERRVGPAETAKRVGLDEKTVRVRVKKMEEDGFIKYYQAVPSLYLLGMNHLSSYRFEALNLTTKRRVVEHLQDTPGIIEAMDYLGTAVSTSITGQSTESIQQIADGITSRFELARFPLGNLRVRNTAIRLDRTDWRILGILRYNARAAASDVAKALSITPKMAEYRIKKLLDSGSMQVRAIIDPSRQKGLIFYELEISLTSSDSRSVMLRLDELGEKVWSIQRPREGVILASLFAFGLGEPEDVTADFMSLNDVKLCSLYILKEVVEARRPNWIDKSIEREAGSLPTPAMPSQGA